MNTKKIKKLNILLAEDDEDHAELTISALTETGIENVVIHVEDGSKALKVLNGENPYENRDRYPKPDLILLDIKMPVLNGMETLEKIRANPVTKSVPVIMLTTSKNPTEIKIAFEKGANSFVTKPVSFNEFTEKIRQLSLYWISVSEIP